MYIDENVPNSTTVRPPTVNLGAEERWVKDRDVGAGTPGSTWLAQMWNDLVANVRELLDEAGIVRVNGPGGDTNLLDAVRIIASQSALYEDSGAANAYVLSPAVGIAPAILNDGLLVYFRPGAGNTAASVVNVGGHGNKAIVREDGSPLQAGDLVTPRDAFIRYDAGPDEWILLDFARPGGHLVEGGSNFTGAGTASDFLGIPPWVKRITLLFRGVSLSGSDDILVQIGDSLGVVTAGYSSRSSSTGNSVGSTVGFIVRITGSGNSAHGTMTLHRVSPTEWVSSHSLGDNGGVTSVGGGSGAVATGPLDRVRITVSGANTFDAGQVSLLFE